MSSPDNTPDALIETDGVTTYDLFGWYWQPEGQWQQEAADVTAITKEVIGIDSVKADLEAGCHQVERQHVRYSEQQEIILGRLQDTV